MNHNNTNELSSFYTSFRADDTLIDIIPAFDYTTTTSTTSSSNNNSKRGYHDTTSSSSIQQQKQQNQQKHINDLFQSTLSSTTIGIYIKAGIITSVPLWMGIVLHLRSYATIVYPTWYNSHNLKYILQYEKNNISLYPTTDSTTSSSDSNNNTSSSKSHDHDHDSNDNDDDNDDDDSTTINDNDHSKNQSTYYLPSNYYEIAMRLKSSNIITSSSSSSSSSTSTSTTNTSSNTTTNIDVITLLIQDIYEIRIDKLRQQFQTLIYETTKKINTTNTTSTNDNDNNNDITNHNNSIMKDLIINVTGIGTQELASIQSFVLQAMNDVYLLSSSSS